MPVELAAADVDLAEFLQRLFQGIRSDIEPLEGLAVFAGIPGFALDLIIINGCFLERIHFHEVQGLAVGAYPWKSHALIIC